jgi:hypothetical protein
MASLTPVWTDNVTVLASQLVARNSVARATLDLRTKHGAFLFIRIGRTGTTALTNGVVVRCNRTLSNDGIGHPAGIGLGPGFAAAAVSTTVNADSAAGQNLLNVASTSGFAVEDYILIGGGTAREEWGRVAQVVSATQLRLDRPLQFTHTAAQADTVRNKADVYPPVWLPGGATWEVIVDYGDDTAGESVRAEVKAQIYDSDNIV